MLSRRPTIDPEQRERERRARIASQRPPVGRVGSATMVGSVRQVAQPVVKLTRKAKVRQDIRDSARGEACTVRYTGVCCGDPEKTILSHPRWLAADKAKGSKGLCIAGAYACVPCDMAYDGQTPMPDGYTRDKLDLEWSMGHFRTLVRLVEKGLV